jgi:hypothetical protein
MTRVISYKEYMSSGETLNFLPASPDAVIAGLDPAIHHFEKSLRRRWIRGVKAAYDEKTHSRAGAVC